jgi:hypothetical protein
MRKQILKEKVKRREEKRDIAKKKVKLKYVYLAISLLLFYNKSKKQSPYEAVEAYRAVRY